MLTLTRKAALSILKGNAALTAIVPASRIHGQVTPASPVWPFIKFGPAQLLPIRASCLNGADISFSVHAFAKALPTETAEDLVARIGAAIVGAIDRVSVPIAGGTIRFRLSDQQLMVDQGEAGSFHYFAGINARVLRQ